MQWGKHTYTNAGTAENVYFPITYTTAYNVTLGGIGNSTSAWTYVNSIFNLYNSYFTTGVYHIAAITRSYWMATGKKN